MVGSVLINRMLQENDFDGLEPVFFSTSNPGNAAPDLGIGFQGILEDAFNLEKLSGLPVIVSCQGSSYTKKVYPELRARGWKGYWIDAASHLRMAADTTIVLDPVNRDVIDKSLDKGVKTFIGGNCTVSLMLMALGGLFKADLVEWVNSSTYQAASGAGARHMIELMKQTQFLGNSVANLIDSPEVTALKIDKAVTSSQKAEDFPTEHFGGVLAGSLIPWIDSKSENGQTREEWKGQAELNKILGTKSCIPIDGICVRVATLRCHSQSFLVKLKQEIALPKIISLIQEANDWVQIVDNQQQDTITELTPVKVSGTMNVPVGRIHHLNIGAQYLGAFSVGDQLLWGAAEPLRRMLAILRGRL